MTSIPAGTTMEELVERVSARTEKLAAWRACTRDAPIAPVIYKYECWSSLVEEVDLAYSSDCHLLYRLSVALGFCSMLGDRHRQGLQRLHAVVVNTLSSFASGRHLSGQQGPCSECVTLQTPVTVGLQVLLRRASVVPSECVSSTLAEARETEPWGRDGSRDRKKRKGREEFRCRLACSTKR